MKEKARGAERDCRDAAAYYQYALDVFAAARPGIERAVAQFSALPVPERYQLWQATRITEDDIERRARQILAEDRAG